MNVVFYSISVLFIAIVVYWVLVWIGDGINERVDNKKNKMDKEKWIKGECRHLCSRCIFKYQCKDIEINE